MVAETEQHLSILPGEPPPGATIPNNSGEALEQAIRHGRHRHVLAVGREFPSACNQADLHVTYVGPIGKLPALRCASASLHDCRQPDALPRMLLAIAQEGRRNHSLAYLDSDHRPSLLMSQLQAMTTLCTPGCWWVINGASPPFASMATASPLDGWWAGQAFALPSLLEPVGDAAAAAVLGLPPAGISFFRGWRPPSPAELTRRLALVPATPDMEDIRRLSTLPCDQALEAFLGIQRLEQPHAGPLDMEGDGGVAVVEELEPETPWEHPSPAVLISARSGEADFSSLSIPPTTLHGSRLVEYRNVIVTGFDALFHGNTLLGRYSQPEQRRDHGERLAVAGAWGYDMSWPVKRDPAQGLVLDPTALKLAGEITEPVLWGTPDEGANWGMWLLMALLSADLFLRHRDRYRWFYCWCPLHWQREFLLAVGIDEASLLQQEANKPWLLRQVGLLEQTRRDQAVTPAIKAAIGRFLQRQGIETAAPPQRLLFVSRLSISRRGAYRALLREEELHQAMRARGFEIVEPETLSLPDQARLFQQAACVVGLGGAGMFNTMFSRPGTKVLMLTGTMEFAPWHMNMFASAGLEAGLILGDEDPTDPSPYQRRWKLDLPKALRGLDAKLREWGFLA